MAHWHGSNRFITKINMHQLIKCLTFALKANTLQGNGKETGKYSYVHITMLNQDGMKT